MRNFLYEMMLSNNRAADNDVNAAIERVTSLKKVKLKTTLPYMGLDRLVPARDTTANGAGECLRLPCARGLCCDSIQAATCLLTNEVGLAPVSNRVVTESEVGLLPVVMQHMRYIGVITITRDV